MSRQFAYCSRDRAGPTNWSHWQIRARTILEAINDLIINDFIAGVGLTAVLREVFREAGVITDLLWEGIAGRGSTDSILAHQTRSASATRLKIKYESLKMSRQFSYCSINRAGPASWPHWQVWASALLYAMDDLIAGVGLAAVQGVDVGVGRVITDLLSKGIAYRSGSGFW